MKISVIIPTYKPKAYLWECLNSLCNQSFHFEDYEIIIVLNGCKEPYDSQINEFIHLHNKQNWRYFQKAGDIGELKITEGQFMTGNILGIIAEKKPRSIRSVFAFSTALRADTRGNTILFIPSP